MAHRKPGKKHQDKHAPEIFAAGNGKNRVSPATARRDSTISRAKILLIVENISIILSKKYARIGLVQTNPSIFFFIWLPAF